MLNSIWSRSVVLIPGRWYFVDFGDRVAIAYMDGWADNGRARFSLLGDEPEDAVQAIILGETRDPFETDDSDPPPS